MTFRKRRDVDVHEADRFPGGDETAERREPPDGRHDPKAMRHPVAERGRQPRAALHDETRDRDGQPWAAQRAKKRLPIRCGQGLPIQTAGRRHSRHTRQRRERQPPHR